MNSWKTRLFKSRLALPLHLISWNGGREFVRPILRRYKATIPVYSRCWIAVAPKKGWEATIKFHRNYQEVMCLNLTFVRLMKKLQRCSVKFKASKKWTEIENIFCVWENHETFLNTLINRILQHFKKREIQIMAFINNYVIMDLFISPITFLLYLIHLFRIQKPECGCALMNWIVPRYLIANNGEECNLNQLSTTKCLIYERVKRLFY